MIYNEKIGENPGAKLKRGEYDWLIKQNIATPSSEFHWDSGWPDESKISQVHVGDGER